MEEESLMRNQEGRNHGGVDMEEESRAIRETSEGIWEASHIPIQ